MLTQAADWTPSTLLALGARNATRLLPFNMVVTNVPGPQVPMYLLGARMLEAYPHVPLADRLGLGIALLSYDGRIGWGFNADYDVVPDLAAVRRRRAAVVPRAARCRRAPSRSAAPRRRRREAAGAPRPPRSERPRRGRRRRPHSRGGARAAGLRSRGARLDTAPPL